MKSFLTIVLSVILFTNSRAQIIANDSVEIGTDSKNSVFYSLVTGQKTTASYNDWHLAVTVRPTQFPLSPLGGTSIRMNEAVGVKIYYVPNANAASFDNIDTAGYKSWTKLHDSDTAIDEGVLNSNRDHADPYDFGWGLYNASTHNVVGDSLYLIELPNGELKKFLMVNLARDTAFNLKYSSLDNSDVQEIHIGKKDYLGKEFVYLNLANNSVTDKEPFTPDWDLQFLKYSATDVLADKVASEVGVWLNKGVTAAKRAQQDVTDNDLTGLNYSAHLNAIGWNWKYPGSTVALLSGKNIFQNLEFYYTKDSLAYFVKVKSGDVYKIVFTKYNVNNGRICFYKEKLSATGIEETSELNTINIYPNPANSVVNIVLPVTNAVLRVMDMTGRLITETTATENVIQLNTSEFATGVYLLQTTIGSKTTVNKFVVNR